MTIRIRNRQNLLFGVFLLFLGAGGILFASDLTMGSAFRMGPGYLPNVLSGAIVLFGLGFVASAFWTDSAEEWGRTAWSGLLFVAGSVVMFALIVKWAGLALTIVLSVLLSSLAATDRRWREVVPFSIGLAVACVVIFRTIFNLHLPIWPQW